MCRVTKVRMGIKERLGTQDSQVLLVLQDLLGHPGKE